MAASVRDMLFRFLLALLFVTSCLSSENEYEIEGIKVIRSKIPKTCDFSAEDEDHLSINYRGTLEDGTEFDSSYKRKRPFSFTLGKGHVIKGWDLGIKGMCIGEKRKLIIPPDKGYGEHGSPPTIPGGATLIFETELMDID